MSGGWWKEVSLQLTLTRRMIRDVGAHINAANYQRTYFKLQMGGKKGKVSESQQRTGEPTGKNKM